MATISFTILDAHLPRIVEAYTVSFDYNNNKLVDETQAQFTKRMIAEEIKLITVNYENNKARKIALDSLTSSSNPDIS